MTYTAFIKVFGGLGLFFFALRFLTGRLNQSVSSRFRPFLERLLANAPQSLGVGVASTALLQASSIVIVTTMGLVDSGLITLEQGFFVMLGSTFGTTIKMWFFLGFVDFGPFLVGLGSLGFLFTRRVLLREAFQLLTAVGLAFVGLQMILGALGGLAQESAFVELARSYQGEGLAQQFSLLLVGLAMAMALQSSTTSILIFMGLAQVGSLTVAAAAALVLGANLGTTSTALLLGVQAENNGRRIALAHFLTKLIGVFITLMLFPSFLSATEWLTTNILSTNRPEFLVAGVHSGFNLINLFWWSMLSVPMLRLVSWLYPTKESKKLGLAKGVRRMLSRAPNRAYVESQEQFRQMELLVKSVYDHVIRSLATTTRKVEEEDILFGDQAQALTSQSVRSRLKRNVESLRETVHDLLFIVSRSTPDKQGFVLRTVSMLEIHSSLTNICFGLYDHLERGLQVEKYSVPDRVSDSLGRFRKLIDQLWLEILLPEKAAGEETAFTEGETLEETILSFNREAGSGHQAQTSWLLELAGYLRSIASALGELNQLKSSAQLELDEVTKTEVAEKTELEEEEAVEVV